MNGLTQTIIEQIFPKDCLGCEALGSHLCDDCFLLLQLNVQSTCFDCGKDTMLGGFCDGCAPLHQLDRILIATEYDQPLIHDLVWNMKFAGVKDIAVDLARLTHSYLNQNHVFNILNIDTQTALAPIPLHQSRMDQRGFNQSELIAVELSRLTGLPLNNYLTRVRSTDSQLGRGRMSRLSALEGAFQVISSNNLPKQVILIDDVVTTGGTLESAAVTLKAAGVQKVFGLAVAKRGL